MATDFTLRAWQLKGTLSSEERKTSEMASEKEVKALYQGVKMHLQNNGNCQRLMTIILGEDPSEGVLDSGTFYFNDCVVLSEYGFIREQAKEKEIIVPFHKLVIAGETEDFLKAETELFAKVIETIKTEKINYKKCTYQNLETQKFKSEDDLEFDSYIISLEQEVEKLQTQTKA
ncbi:hypothetical protein DRJ25_05280 [Candidatus Woesearchaeota archaeon]|nr:MAG: hypothetical protein DRJ25_05280 [Candidatus Woesearchaeota archaeon]